ncbi:hypothetical protein L4C37_15850 [Vibrio kagoshimensis]|uniref:hypothetical protein n=1 Tax=Vibrio kagoshimensis TaxID=2910244 RepID=UPI003D1BD6EB
MFVIISIVTSLVILATLFHYSTKRQATLSQKFETLVLIRQILQLSRQHRAATHYALSCKLTSEAISKVNEIYADILETSDSLQTKAPLDSRPMYRIYQNKLKMMHDDWQSRSLARNQTIHGKSIRHSMYLLDEVMINWLIQSEREDMMSEYHMNWQQVLDSMEVLTKLRICIPDMDSIDDQQRVKFYCDKTVRKLNQLALICPLSIASPIGCRAIHELSELASSETITLSPKAMYDLTSDVSTVIAQVFDQVLSDMTESLYQPLPTIPSSMVEGYPRKHSFV